MKITKGLILSFVLCCFSLLAAVCFVGCGEVSLSTLKESFEKLDKTIAQYSQENDKVFVEGVCEGLTTKLLVSGYGDFVDGKISQANEASYVELFDLYNVTLVISSDYVEKNRTYIFGLDEKKLSKESSNCVKILNGSLQAFTNSIKSFADARKSLMQHFEKFGGLDANVDAKNLLNFKQKYGDLVKKNVKISSDMAEFVESTKIFQLLKSTNPTAADTATVKEYARAKMLSIFSEFKIGEIASKMNWSAQKDGDGETKAKIESLIDKTNDLFKRYKDVFLTKPVKTGALTSEEIKTLFDNIDNFFVESEDYFQALYGLNLANLSVNHDNNMKNYLKENQFAEIYLQKLQQFMTVTLESFMDAVSSKIFD